MPHGGPARVPRPVTLDLRPVLEFIDKIVIPFLNSLYGAVGYLGVMVAMAIESAMIPLPSELILPYAGFLVSDPSQLEPITGKPWNFWIVVVVATIGNTIGSLVAYAIGAWGGRPFLERWGKYMLIRPHEIEAADRFFVKWGKPTVFIGRLLPVVRTFISFPAGVTRMPSGRSSSIPPQAPSCGASPWSGSASSSAPTGWTSATAPAIRHADAGAGHRGGLAFLWWRLGTPGRRRGAATNRPAADGHPDGHASRPDRTSGRPTE